MVINLNIEEEIFNRSSIKYDKLLKYGFKKENNQYIFEKNFLNNNFKSVIIIDEKGNLSGKVIDLEFNLEYTNIRTNVDKEFVNKVRDEYKKILLDIKSKCFDEKKFLNNQTNNISEYIKVKYAVEPEFLWKKYPHFAIFRNKNNKKWFALITNINKSKIAIGSKEIELLNIKLNKEKIKKLLNKQGFYEAYHMNKTSWISIILDNTLNDEDIFELINESYDLINK